jgi:hypothetical protein
MEKRTLLGVRIAWILLPAFLSAPVFGQSPADAAKAAQNLEEWRNSRAPELRNDLGELVRYREANAIMAPLAQAAIQRALGSP